MINIKKGMKYGDKISHTEYDYKSPWYKFWCRWFIDNSKAHKNDVKELNVLLQDITEDTRTPEQLWEAELKWRNEHPVPKHSMFVPTATCINCKQPIMYDEGTQVWTHDWDRWKSDNGYYCYKNTFSHSAEYIKEEPPIKGYTKK